ncbi:MULTISPECIES: glycosyltransferase family 2 protein [Microcystis]|uniref:Glucosyl-3-phosphoglycerate synthase n=1 Tax=Microcystis aeruginosa NIES-44 TaxID=449439 RepID=A0A0A1W0U7_MICAE|nr:MULTISPECIES: glycosyltransferase family 2 protein [Microcystis]MBD2116249.1 glycosyltransferase family 2 protein [Microcystis wesenbergii FACHB-1339]GAL95605.1 structural elements; cell exterior; surface polysaccharides/antigens [Microcystis aeruginosa NIES-44]
MSQNTEYFLCTYPTVTVAIPTYNEADHIESVIRGFLQTSYPKLLEILVADGGSQDETQALVKKLSLADSRVKLIINPLKIQSAALNQMLSEAKGDVFLRADAHCDYAPDYIEKCVEALLESKALNVGGSQRFVATNDFQAGLAIASRSFLGNGGAKYRDPNYDGYADTVFIGCFWRKALLEIALEPVQLDNPEEIYEVDSRKILTVFDPFQVTNQDAELNLRLKEKQNNAIYVSSKIKVYYYPRSSWETLFIQYFKYGRGRYLTFLKHPQSTPTRSKLPLIIFITIILFFLLDILWLNNRLHSQLFLVVAIVFILAESIRINYKYRDDFDLEIWRGKKEKIPNFFSRVFWCTIAFLIMPTAYFSGNIYQIYRHKVLKIEKKF